MPSRPSVMSRARLIISLADVGEFTEASRLADEATRMADVFNEVFGQALAYAAVGELCLARGQFPRAISALERSLVHCESVPLFFPSTSRSPGHRELGATLPPGSCPGGRAPHAPARGPLPPRPRQALLAHRQARPSTRAPHHRDDDVPRDGHA